MSDCTPVACIFWNPWAKSLKAQVLPINKIHGFLSNLPRSTCHAGGRATEESSLLDSGRPMGEVGTCDRVERETVQQRPVHCPNTSICWCIRFLKPETSNTAKKSARASSEANSFMTELARSSSPIAFMVDSSSAISCRSKRDASFRHRWESGIFSNASCVRSDEPGAVASNSGRERYRRSPRLMGRSCRSKIPVATTWTAGDVPSPSPSVR